MNENEISERVIGAAIEVHRHLGPGLLESVYEECLCHELSLRGIEFVRQKYVPIRYKGLTLATELRCDLIVKERVFVELKSIDTVIPLHEMQLLTYLRISGMRLGLLMNFNVPCLRDGLHRVSNDAPSLPPRPSAFSASPR